MNESQVSIGRVKSEISELLSRVAFGGERIAPILWALVNAVDQPWVKLVESAV